MGVDSESSLGWVVEVSVVVVVITSVATTVVRLAYDIGDVAGDAGQLDLLVSALQEIHDNCASLS